jgi:hypothetical protein
VRKVRPVPDPLDRTIVHFALNDPREVRGGVETFGRTLGRFFREVVYMTPKTLDVGRIRAERLPVVCDNQWVLAIPAELPVIGFQHGVAREKFKAIPNRETFDLARRQARAARRPNTLWLAGARWISETFGSLYGNRAEVVIYYPVDLERFDGRLANQGSRVVAHDGRTPHKGSRIYPWLAREFPEWRFEPLLGPTAEVPDRLREASAFFHLSSYEGNSVMCTEAMAMNLPCFFTRVGLFRDGHPLDVASIPRTDAFGPFARLRRGRLIAEVRAFLGSLATRRYEPRRWIVENASLPAARDGWARAMTAFDRLPWQND